MLEASPASKVPAKCFLSEKAQRRCVGWFGLSRRKLERSGGIDEEFGYGKGDREYGYHPRGG